MTKVQQKRIVLLERLIALLKKGDCHPCLEKSKKLFYNTYNNGVESLRKENNA